MWKRRNHSQFTKSDLKVPWKACKKNSHQSFFFFKFLIKKLFSIQLSSFFSCCLYWKNEASFNSFLFFHFFFWGKNFSHLFIICKCIYIYIYNALKCIIYLFYLFYLPILHHFLFTFFSFPLKCDSFILFSSLTFVCVYVCDLTYIPKNVSIFISSQLSINIFYLFFYFLFIIIPYPY